MTLPRVLALALLCSALSVAVATSPLPGQTGAADEPPRSRPVNLKVLPADIAPATLGRLMKRYGQDLGVECSYCHVENRDTGKLDYVSDENPRKQTARVMAGMLQEINDKYLAQLGADSRYASEVTCGSCHQGRSNPAPFEPRWR
jgi:hypothetical protein